MAQPAVNMQQLMEMMAQLIQNQAANHPAPQNQPAIVPPLPDVIPFEHSMDNRSRITEWIERFNFSLDCAAPDLADDLKVKALMNKLSESAFSEYSRFILPSKVTDFTFKVTTEKLEKLFAKQQSVFIDRFECLRAEKEENESFRDFVNRHKRLLRDFDFANMNEEQFKTLMLLLALKAPKDAVLRQKILAKLTTDNDITYDGVVEECLAFLATIMESKMVESQPIKNVNMVKNGKNPWKGKANKNSKPQSNEKQSNSGQSCWRCGRNHQPKDCQFKDAICNQCNQKGHLKKRCEAIKEWRRLHPFKGNKDKLNKNVGIVNISAIHKKINSTNLLRIEILLNNKPIEFILDSGAEVNVIDERSWKAIGQPKISKCVEKGRVYDGTQKEFMGKGMGTFEFQGFKTDQEFFVAKNGMMNLLSVTTMDEFGLLDHIKQRISSKEINAVIPPNVERKNSKEEPNAEFIPKEFPNIFKEELGHCTKVKAHLTLNNNATPIFRRARPVPYNVKEVVDKELDRLESMGVIEKIEHANWAAPILVVKKANGSARMCIDFSTGLNEALLSNKHPLPVPEDIFATLNGGKYFSQLDLRDAYFQIELDEDSQKLCCIATHRGLYKLTRLPFGVKTAPSIFQSIMDAMLSGLPFACAYLDDIIIVGRTIEEHKNNIREVLKRIESYGFRLKLEKCSFFKKEIKYLGVIINEMGRKPDPEKIKAIAKMPAPHDIATLRSFLGMVNHYQQFVQNMRFIRKPMDDLLRKDSKWNWDENCIKAFTKIKEILSSNLLLTHYDPAQQIIVAADASENGIGAVIKHRFPDGTEKAIAHASSALTPAEKNYSQIEKEGLALIFAIQKFHKMIYGRHFILQTDHRPLLSIFGNKKGIRQCSANRLLRWSLILLAYDFSIEYVNTTEFGEADALSRLIARAESGENDRVIASLEAENDYDVMIENTSKIFPLKFDDLVSETAKENLLQKVIKFVKNGWPNPKQIPNESEQIQLFYRRKDELTVHKGCLMYAERLVIPTIFQKCVLEILHKGHPGVKRMKQLARQYVYWPKLDSQIENFVKNCEPCQSVLRAPVKTHLHSWPKPLGPWDRVHVDYAGPFFGKDFLIIVDAFSKYPEVFEMPTKSSKATIEKLRYLFSRHGLPHTLVSDNGTQFTSSEFVKFMAANGITHLKSAPYNPMSNGQAERFVDTFKRSFKKMKGEGKMDSRIIETFLVSYRTTPNDSLENNKSPAELFLGRRPRTALDLLKPPPLIPNERNEAMEKQFNRRFGTRVRTFAVGDKVFAKHRLSQSWKTGIINKRNGVIYEVIFPNGTSNRFHANQLRERHTKDNEDENNLMVFYELFKLPPPPMNEPVIEPEIVVQPDEPIIENEIPVMVENPQPVVIENPRRSQRNRKGTIRYSPG